MTTTRYLWNPINQNIIREYDGAGNTVASYTTEPDLYGDVVSQHRDGQDSVYHYDGQENVLAITDDASSIADRYAYRAFGEVTEHTGDTVNAFRFGGQRGYYWDEETGVCDVRQRPFSPRNGRWLSCDLLLEFPGYLYVRNNPVSRSDPSGLVEMDLSPKTAINAPWCEVGCNAPILRPGGAPKPADPNGLPPNVYGKTEVIDYSIDCGCICRTINPTTYELRCRMWAYLKILISPDNIKASPEPHSVRGTYGHEQRHVRNFLDGATKLADEVTRFEAQVYKTFGSCISTKDLLESFIRSHLEGVVTANAAHDWGEYLNERGMEPKKGTDYDPLGGKMPTKPDCALPGSSKNSGIEDRHCREIMSRFGPNPVE